MSKVINVNGDCIYFDDEHKLYSEHSQDCCENHYLDFSGLTAEDFKHLEFDLSTDAFFERVEDFGIRLVATNGTAIPIPGYASNNGYYSSDLYLVLAHGMSIIKEWDIQECQSWE